MPTMIDLFCGAGGMTAGFRAAGFTPVLAADIDPVATATYAANHGEHVVTGSVADLREVPKADLVIGGPPCQGFSALGLRDPDDPRNQLWREYLRVVAAARPAAFVMENVARFAESPEFAMLLGQARPGGTLDGYHLTWGVLNAADYGVPQARKRTILIGTRSPLPGMPEPTTAGRRPTVRNAIADLATVPVSHAVAKPWVTGPAAHVVRVDSATNLTRYRHIPPGGNRHDLPAELQYPAWRRKPKGTGDAMGRMRWDEPAPTVHTNPRPDKGRYVHPELHRPITALEAARLQGFADTYRWTGSRTAICRQIGNAVPPPLARIIGEHLMRHVFGE